MNKNTLLSTITVKRTIFKALFAALAITAILITMLGCAAAASDVSPDPFSASVFSITYHELTGNITSDTITIDTNEQFVMLSGIATAPLLNYDSNRLTIQPGTLTFIPNSAAPSENVKSFTITDPSGTEAITITLGDITAPENNELYELQLSFDITYNLSISDDTTTLVSAQHQTDTSGMFTLARCEAPASAPYTFSLHSLDAIDTEFPAVNANINPNLNSIPTYFDSSTPENNTNVLTITATPATGGGSIVYDSVDIAIQECTEDSANFAGGDGSQDNPYEIDNDLRLELMSRLVNRWQSGDTEDYRDDYYVLTADLDLKITGAPWASGNGFTPIGKTPNVSSASIDSQTNDFSGQLDCNSFTISNLYISNTNHSASAGYEGNYIGLFGVINNNAVITNCTLENIDLHGHGFVGGLVGWHHSGSISGNTLSQLTLTANDRLYRRTGSSAITKDPRYRSSTHQCQYSHWCSHYSKQ